MQKKKKSRNCCLLRLFEIVSLIISQSTLNLQPVQGNVPACRRQIALCHVHVRAACGLWWRIKEGIILFYLTPSIERFVNAFVSRKDDLWSTPAGFCHFSYISRHCRSHFWLRRGRGKVPCESSFVCPRCVNFWDDPSPCFFFHGELNPSVFFI